MTRYIGLGHYSRTGKDSLANYLLLSLKRRKIAAVKYPFAYKLKDIAHQLYGWAGLHNSEYYETSQGAEKRGVVLPDLGLSPLDVWVKLGTKAIRENVYDRTWIDYLIRTVHTAAVVVVPDVRFPNEVEALRSAGAMLIKVVRPGFGQITEIDHQLDDYDGWDAVVGQSGKMDELQAYARLLAFWLQKGGEFPRKA